MAGISAPLPVGFAHLWLKGWSLAIVMEQADVIVIGGGVAGLAAAGELARLGRRVILLEAQERIGGRIRTARRRGWKAPIELGAEFVHEGNEPFWRLARKHRLRSRRIPPRHWHFDGAALQPLEDVAGRIKHVTARIDAQRMRGWTFADFLRFKARTIADLDRDVVSGFVEGFEAAPMDEMSATALEGETLQDEKQFSLPDGYDSVVMALQRAWPQGRVTLHQRTVVRRIEWRRGKVMVRAGADVFAAAAAVVTLPLGVLQSRPPAPGAVQFVPALRGKERVLAKLRMGHVVRVCLRFHAAQWRRMLPPGLRRAGSHGFGFVHSRIAGMPIWWHLGDVPAITGWAGGPAAMKLARHTDAAIRDKALASLGAILGVPKTALHSAVADWAMHNWSRDPFCRGGYSFILAGQEDAAKRLATSVQGTLFFAGEATAEADEIGTVHGALSSGLRAAGEVRRAAPRRMLGRDQGVT